ncbi:MAG: hypothetical protein H7Y36_04490 [Armatimonadetes bacterium]|nr:hypothetical protein [Akkermansiaceae bacterium]
MKILSLLCSLFILQPELSYSAPRLVLSTPSLLPESKIDIVFDQPMVEADILGKEVQNTLVITKPLLDAKLFWKAPTVAEFRPEKIPQIGAEYHFSLKSGVKHLDGSALKQGEFASVATERFGIHTSLIPDRWSENYTRSTGSWMIVFNDDVDLASIAGFFSFTSEGKQRVAPQLKYATAEQSGYYRTNYLTWKNRIKPEAQIADVPADSLIKNIVIVSPNSPLPIAKLWELQVLKGLPNMGKSASLGEDVSYQIGEVEPFKILGVDGQLTASSPRRITVGFNQVLPKEISEELVSIVPEPKNLSMTVFEKTLTLNGDFSQDDTYTVSVRDVESLDKQPLGNAGNFEVKFERLSAQLSLPSEDEAQLAHGLRKYAVDTVNLSKVKIRIKKLNGKGLVRTYQGYRNYSGRGPNYKGIEPVSVIPYALIPGKTIVEKEIDLGIAVDTGKLLELAWDELLPKDAKCATLFLDVIGIPHPEAAEKGRRNAQAIIQLTDIGLAWKSTDQSALVYAFSCQTGKPLPGVKIEVFGEDASQMVEASTDANGIATVPRKKSMRHLQATLAGDSYTVAFDKTLSEVGMWHFPVRHSWMKQLPESRRAFLFTDRSLYRPGERVRIKGIVRDQLGNAIALGKKATARIVIIDPEEKEIFTKPVELSALGSFDLIYTLPEIKTGDHTIKLEFPDELEIAKATEDWEKQIALTENASFSLPLKVEEFRRNTFEIVQGIDNPAIGASEIGAKLAATYYQGQPVAAGKASTFSQVTTVNPYPERYRDFLFGSHRLDDWRYWYNYFGYRDQNEETTVSSASFTSSQVLSQEGRTDIQVKLPKGDFPATQEVLISTEVTDANNQTLTAKSSTIVHPAALYAGISRVDRLIRVGEKTPFKLVVTDTEGEPAKEAVTLSAILSRQLHTTTKTTNANGDTVTESEAGEEIISTTEVVVPAEASAAEGFPFPFSPVNPGLHFLTVKGTDSEGREFATVSRFHVYGADEFPWEYEDGIRIKLVSEKKSYKPGDVARVLVLSPIEGTALVTVEREKVLSSFLTEIKAENPVIEIPLGDEHAPNAFVSILIVKGAGESAREIKEPQLRLGYCELIVENQRDRLQVAISAPEENYRPGSEIELGGTVRFPGNKPAENAEVILYAVDEGTLAVMGYDTPDPMDFFYDPRTLSVSAGTSFQTFLSENAEMRSFSNKGFFIGGGGDLSKLAELYRKNFDPCAAWAPTLTTDAEGKFSHRFKLPDTLTRYRVIAIAHHKSASFGHSESAIVVKKPLMLEPKLPRFAHQGDLLSTQVMVQNASEHTATWEVTCTIGDGLETPIAAIQGSSQQTLTLAPNASSVLAYPMRVDNTGDVKISFSAKPISMADGVLSPKLTASLSDAVEETFVSHFPMPLLRQVKSIRLAANTGIDLRDHLSKEMQAATGSIGLEFARSPLIEASSSIDYLLQYPYGCAEQTSSSLMPWLAVKNLKPYVPAFAKRNDKDVNKSIQTGVSRLLSMQRPDGSFGYWPGDSVTNDWVTPYAGMVLTLASKNGGNVPPSALESLSQYLIQSLRGAGEARSSYELENLARSLYTLALLDKSQPPYHSLMAEKLPLMSDTARALLAAAMAVSSEASPKVLAVAKGILTSNTPYKPLEMGGYWSPGNSDPALRLIAWMAIDPDAEETHKALEKLLGERNPYGHWRSTWVNGWSLLALSHYASNESFSDTPARLVLETNEGAEDIVLSKDHPSDTRSFPLTPATGFKVNSSEPAYLRMKVAAKPAIAPLAAVAKNGLSINRFYEKILPSGQTNVLRQPALGDLIRVTLQVTLPKDNTRYLVVDDPLPAIFETVNSDFATQSSAQNVRTSDKDWNISHSELRSDRAVFFMDHVYNKGTYKVTYLVRCTMAGDVNTPPAKVESMYEPENFALSASQKFVTN